jgi:hypothetical protein
MVELLKAEPAAATETAETVKSFNFHAIPSLRLPTLSTGNRGVFQDILISGRIYFRQLNHQLCGWIGH